MNKYVLFFGVRSVDRKYEHEVISQEKYESVEEAIGVLKILKMFYQVLIGFLRKEKHGKND